MNKIFRNTVYLTGIFGLVSGLFSACSDSSSVAGTAEEPNQIAVEDVSSSSVVAESSSDVIPSSSSNVILSSSSNVILNGSEGSSSSSNVIPSSSSNVILNGSEGSSSSSSSETPPDSNSDYQPQVTPPSNSVQPKTLDNFIKQYVNDVNTKFDDNVLAYNLVYEKQCGGASDDCEDATPVYYELITPGLHKDMDMSYVEMLFPKTIEALAKTPNADDEYCPFYLLNVSPLGMDGGYTPETGFILANIENDKLTVIALRSHSCEYVDKDRVFGILFRYCGELSSSPKIEYIEPDGIYTMECRPPNSIDVSSEWENKNLL